MRSDMACGSTIGPILASGLGCRTVDVGAPQARRHNPTLAPPSPFTIAYRASRVVPRAVNGGAHAQRVHGHRAQGREAQRQGS